MKALFPLDGSEASYRAFRRGLEMLKGHGSLRAVAFNVRQPGFDGASEDAVQRFDEDEHDEVFPTLASSERCLARAKEIAGELGLSIDTKSAVGVPYETILEESKGYDVIVIHALSKSNLRDLLRGSTSEKLVRNAPTSVLVVRD